MGAQTGQQLENSPHYYFDPYLTFGVNVLTDLASARTLDALGIEPEHGRTMQGLGHGPQRSTCILTARSECGQHDGCNQKCRHIAHEMPHLPNLVNA